MFYHLFHRHKNRRHHFFHIVPCICPQLFFADSPVVQMPVIHQHVPRLPVKQRDSAVIGKRKIYLYIMRDSLQTLGILPCIAHGYIQTVFDFLIFHRYGNILDFLLCSLILLRKISPDILQFPAPPVFFVKRFKI